jgi:hypothetical protein
LPHFRMIVFMIAPSMYIPSIAYCFNKCNSEQQPGSVIGVPVSARLSRME